MPSINRIRLQSEPSANGRDHHPSPPSPEKKKLRGFVRSFKKPIPRTGEQEEEIEIVEDDADEMPIDGSHGIDGFIGEEGVIGGLTSGTLFPHLAITLPGEKLESETADRGDEFLTTTQAAAHAGYHPSHLLWLVKVGKWPQADWQIGIGKVRRLWKRSTCEKAIRDLREGNA
jgi:hypothetical protein